MAGNFQKLQPNCGLIVVVTSVVYIPPGWRRGFRFTRIRAEDLLGCEMGNLVPPMLGLKVWENL